MSDIEHRVDNLEEKSQKIEILMASIHSDLNNISKTLTKAVTLDENVIRLDERQKVSEEKIGVLEKEVKKIMLKTTAWTWAAIIIWMAIPYIFKIIME